MEKAAYIIVNYVTPGLKIFAMFLLVMFVLAFWSKAKEGKLIDMAGVIFEGTLNYTYKFFYYLGIGVWLFFSSIFRGIRIVMAIIRDFFMSRI